MSDTRVTRDTGEAAGSSAGGKGRPLNFHMLSTHAPPVPNQDRPVVPGQQHVVVLVVLDKVKVVKVEAAVLGLPAVLQHAFA